MGRERPFSAEEEAHVGPQPAVQRADGLSNSGAAEFGVMIFREIGKIVGLVECAFGAEGSIIEGKTGAACRWSCLMDGAHLGFGIQQGTQRGEGTGCGLGVGSETAPGELSDQAGLRFRNLNGPPAAMGTAWGAYCAGSHCRAAFVDPGIERA